MDDHVWIEIIKAIGYKKVGEVYRYHPRKAKAVIASGHGRKISAPKQEKPAKAQPRVETATATPAAETAEIPPVEKPTSNPAGILNLGRNKKAKK